MITVSEVLFATHEIVRVNYFVELHLKPDPSNFTPSEITFLSKFFISYDEWNWLPYLLVLVRHSCKSSKVRGGKILAKGGGMSPFCPPTPKRRPVYKLHARDQLSQDQLPRDQLLQYQLLKSTLTKATDRTYKECITNSTNQLKS